MWGEVKKSPTSMEHHMFSFRNFPKIWTDFFFLENYEIFDIFGIVWKFLE